MTKRSDIQKDECSAYFFRYIEQADEDVDLIDALAKGKEETDSFFRTLSKDQWGYRYAPGKWTPREILLHLMDTERIFAYRSLCFARSKYAVLPGFDQDEFAANVDADSRNTDDLIEEYHAVRGATLALFKSLNKEELKRTGKASGNRMSARAAGFILCGHDRHHIKVIKERYL